MPSCLETTLKTQCASEGLDLSEQLARIRRSAQEIWAEPRLLWFTDHGVRHSERIVGILGEILDHIQETEEGLSAQELFILLAACYLHDIGMQDFVVDGRGMEQLRIEDYDLIRKRHPRRSKDLIIGRSLQRGRGQFSIDMDDQPAYLVPIAVVSQAHGSEYFESSIEELRQMPHRPGGKKIRGDLLASLLMIADELDLHEERARIPQEMSLSPVSTLHNYTHHYIAGVSVIPGRSARERTVHLAFDFPSDDEECAHLLRLWVVGRIQRQLRRTADVVHSTTRGELTWGTQIQLEESIDQYHVRLSLPPVARVELTRCVAEQETANYHDAREAIEAMLAADSLDPLLCIVGREEVALAHISGWLGAICQHRDVGITHLDFRYDPRTVNDVLTDLSERLAAGRSEHTGDQSVAERLSLLMEEAEGYSESRRLIVFQNFHWAERSVVRWFAREFLKEWRDRGKPFSLLVGCTNLPMLSEEGQPKMKTIHVGNFAERDIAAHLHRQFGFVVESANSKAEEIYGTSGGGSVEGVLFALSHLRLEEAGLKS